MSIEAPSLTASLWSSSWCSGVFDSLESLTICPLLYDQTSPNLVSISLPLVAYFPGRASIPFSILFVLWFLPCSCRNLLSGPLSSPLAPLLLKVCFSTVFQFTFSFFHILLHFATFPSLSFSMCSCTHNVICSIIYPCSMRVLSTSTLIWLTCLTCIAVFYCSLYTSSIFVSTTSIIYTTSSCLDSMSITFMAKLLNSPISLPHLSKPSWMFLFFRAPLSFPSLPLLVCPTDQPSKCLNSITSTHFGKIL